MDFLFIWLIFGILAVIRIGLKFKYKELEMEDYVADVSWGLGMSRRDVKILIFLLAFTFGIIILPAALVLNLYEEITGKRL